MFWMWEIKIFSSKIVKFSWKWSFLSQKWSFFEQKRLLCCSNRPFLRKNCYICGETDHLYDETAIIWPKLPFSSQKKRKIPCSLILAAKNSPFGKRVLSLWTDFLNKWPFPSPKSILWNRSGTAKSASSASTVNRTRLDGPRGSGRRWARTVECGRTVGIIGW